MPANNINQPRAANNTIASKLVETVVTSEYEDNPIPIKPANKALAGRKIASVKDDLGKTQLTKDVEKQSDEAEAMKKYPTTGSTWSGL